MDNNIDYYNLKYLEEESGYLSLYFVNKKTRGGTKYTPPFTFYGKELDEQKLLDKTGIIKVPFEELYPDFSMEVGKKYDYGLANFKKDIDAISINPDSEFKEFILLHEVAHVLLKHKGSNKVRSIRELEANAVAFLVLSQFKDKDTMIDLVNYFGLHVVGLLSASCIQSMEVADQILSILNKK